MADPEFVDDAPKAAAKGSDPQFVDDSKDFVDDAPKSVSPNLIKTSYGQVIDKAAGSAGINPNEMLALHSIEDPTEDPKAKSRSGAIGEMQMKPGTFGDYAKPNEKIDNPVDNFDVSARYLAFLNKHYNGDMDKVFAAYNAGQGAVDAGTNNNTDYVKQAEANLEALAVSYQPPKKELTKGTQPKKKVEPPKEDPTPEPSRASNDADFITALDQAAGQAFEGKYQGEAAALGARNDVSPIASLPKASQEAIKNLVVKPVANTAQFVNNLAAIPLDFLNAGMRDLANGNQTEGSKVAAALYDGLLKHPLAYGDVLDTLARHYGPNSADETKFWTQMPGMADGMKNAKPKTPEGQALQAITLMHADVSRFLATHTGLRDLQTFAEYLFNPGIHIPGMILGKGVPGLTKLGAKGVGKVIEHTPQKFQDHIDNINKTAKDTFDSIYTVMPMGDRFHKSYVKGGEQFAAEHRGMATRQAKAPEIIMRTFGQSHVLGNTSVPQRNALLRYHDKFYNSKDTMHLRQPQGGDPIYDPITRTTVMNKGGLYGVTYQEHMNHVFVQHPNRLRLEVPKGSEVKVALGPKEKDFFLNLKAGRYSEALQLHPKISPQEADAFEASIKARAPGGPGTPVGRKWMDEQAKLRLLSEHISTSGYDAANWGDQVVFQQRPTALVRDLSDVNGTPMDERTFYTAAIVHAIDAAVLALAPSAASNFIEGFLPRSGMFKEEPTTAQIMEMQRTAQQQGRQGGSGLKPNGPARKFDSIQHAEDAPPHGGGLKQNPDFDMGTALQKAMIRSIRFQNYVRDLSKYATPIDYQEAVDNSGVGFTVPTTFAFKHGLDGRKEFDAMVAAEAKARVKSSLTQQQYDALSDPNSIKKLEKFEHDQMVHIYDQVQKSWEAAHPNMVWNTAEQTGVDDLHGMTIPTMAKDAAIDSHPAFDGKKGTANMESMLTHEDTPVTMVENAIDSFFHMARSVFLSDPTYHETENLEFIGAATGHLNPMEMLQVFFAPHTVPQEKLERAEAAGALAPGYGHGVSGSQARTRYGFAGSGKPTDRNLIRRNTTGLPQRIKDTYKAYQNSVDGAKNPFEVAQHILGRAMYQGDKWNQDLTFKVWEDTTAAVIFDKFKQQGLSDEIAAGKTRERMGDTVNMTERERALGLQRLEWFYSWFKSQFRLWAKNALNPKTVAVSSAIQGTVRSHNENDPNIPNPEQMSNYGQTVFYVNGEPYIITAEPAPIRKLNAITSLMSTPVTQGLGLMDFMEFTVSDLAHSLNPAAKLAFEQMPATFGMQAAKAEGVGDVMSGVMGGVASTLTPPAATAIKHGMSDPVRYLELLGTPVHKLYDQSGAIVPSVEAKDMMKLRDTLLRNADSESRKEAILEQYNPLINRLLQQQQQDYGR